LATPIALTVAAGALAKDGLLVTRGHAIETLARATHFVFDKTGTLTTGQMHLVDLLLLAESDKEQVLAIAAALESASEHPVASALVQLATPISRLSVCNLVSEAGQGVSGEIDGRLYRIGRPAYALELCGGNITSLPSAWLESGDTLIALADETCCLALFKIGDTLRSEAKALVAMLAEAGRKVILLTGDGHAVAQRIAKELAIDEFQAGKTPEQKHAFVAELQAAGHIVAMIGDGVNDAPVLAQAQVSIAMGGGAHLARTQADFVLLSENLDHLQQGLLRAMKTLSVIRQNLWWSFAYNFVALPLAIAGLVTPWLAGIGMSASSLLVVLNSLRIQHLEKK